jgi:uncharacterized protein (TIGR00730 family)
VLISYKVLENSFAWYNSNIDIALVCHNMKIHDTHAEYDPVLDNQNKPRINVPISEIERDPITIQEIEEEAKKRISRIDKEFTKGFDFIKEQKRSVSFFGSSRIQEGNVHYEQARRLASQFTKLGYTVISGGGPGIMEGANRGAFEAGGRSFGLSIKLPNEQAINSYLTDNLEFYYFFTRKVMLSFSAEAYLFFPGGFGTLDEFFEIITLIQTHKIEKVPVIAIGVDYWSKLQDFIYKEMYQRHAAIDKADMDLYVITDNEEEVVDIVTNAPSRNGVRYVEEPTDKSASTYERSTQ